MSKRVAILTSGGDAPGMNACLRATIIACERAGYTLFGYEHGYNGLIAQEYRQLSLSSTHNLIQQGGTILHSARSKAFKTIEGAKTSAENLSALNIDTLIVIGGDGSFRGAEHLSNYWPGQIIGIPGTIDNDIQGTDATIGFYTAVDTAVSSIDKVRDTADAFERIFLVEVMGREAGFLALHAAIASASDYVILPETFHDEESELNSIVQQIENRRLLRESVSYIVVVAENVWPGGLHALTQSLNKKGIADIRPVTLGHVQRGGSPTSQDRILATNLGRYAVDLVGTDVTNVMIGERNQRIVEVPLADTWKSRKPLNNYRLDTMQKVMNERF